VGDRIALVIGNAEYQHAPMLANPMNDAAAVAEALRQLDFKTDLHRNLGLMELRRALANFSDASESAEMAVVYFAGHGVEISGTNYLVPIDAQPETIGRVRWETMPLDEVLSVVENAEQLRLIILDACRDNPFVGRMRGLEATRSLGRGLGSIEPHGNTLVAYAAKHGTKANDGPLGGNSPFAEALVQHIGTPDLEVRLLFGRVRDAVLSKTNNSQEPYLYGTLGGDPIYLKRDIIDSTRDAAANADAQEAVRALRDNRLLEAKDIALIQAWVRTYGAKAPEFDRELVRRHRDTLLAAEAADWSKARERDDAEAYRGFLADWPTGPHVEDADGRLTALQKSKETADAWAAVCQSESLVELDDFLTRHGDSEHAPAAKARRQEVAHRIEWQEALSRSDDIERLEGFIANSPGPFTEAARVRLDALREAATLRDADAHRPPPPVPPPAPPTEPTAGHAQIQSPPIVAAEDIAPNRMRSWSLPMTTTGAALVGGVMYTVIQSMSWSAAFYSVYTYAIAALFAAPMALAAGVHERRVGLGAWVFATAGVGYLAGGLLDQQVDDLLYGIVTRWGSVGRAMYWPAHLALLALSILAPMALRFRALPAPWALPVVIGIGLIVGMLPPADNLLWMVEYTVIPWAAYGACVGSVVQRRKSLV